MQTLYTKLSQPFSLKACVVNMKTTLNALDLLQVVCVMITTLKGKGRIVNKKWPLMITGLDQANLS